MIGIASVLLVITPISWILLHQPQNDPADASVPIVTRTDDTYITPTTKPVVAPPSSHPSTPPTVPPTATPTQTPTAGPTDTPSTSTTPTDGPTATPTKERATTTPTPPDRTVSTTKPRPTQTTTAPPPPVDGQMTGDEKQLFSMIDSARVDNGCAPLKQDPNLTGGARSDATDRAKTGKKLNSGSGSEAGAGGDNMTAQQAFDQMMSNHKNTILNCGLTTLGVGTQGADYSTGVLCPLFCSSKTRVAWVADFS